MFIIFEDRLSDSPFIERIWRCRSTRTGTFHSVAANHFEMAVTRHRGKTFMTLRGPRRLSIVPPMGSGSASGSGSGRSCGRPCRGNSAIDRT